MLAAAIASLVLGQEGTPQTVPPNSDRTFYEVYIGDPMLATTRLHYMISRERLDPPKLSPKQFGDPPAPWQFDWIVTGNARVRGEGLQGFNRRFAVYSQSRQTHEALGQAVVRSLLRFWERIFTTYQIDHDPNYKNRTVDVYLCWGGKPGGEHELSVERVDGRTFNVNTIYIYDLPSFSDPAEMLRELAHEYGHAVLWPTGGYSEPEEWANGYLGEKLLMRWMRDQLQAGRLGTLDSMGATFEQVDAWVKKHADPLTEAAASFGPRLELLQGRDQSAMDGFIGLALLAEELLPPSVFERAMRQTIAPSGQPEDLVGALVQFVEVRPETVLQVSTERAKKPFWVPLGQGRVRGATVLERRQGWAKIRAEGATVTLLGPAESANLR